MRRGLVALGALLACVWAVPALSAGFTVPPTPSHFVTDSGGALSQDAKTALESELAAYQKATGHQIIVWIGDTTGDVPLETWTGDSAHQWKIGRRGHDDGAVLFLFMKDHKVRIEVGYGLEGSLTDADASRIIQDDITPRMRSGNVDEAVSSGVAAMLTTITPSYKDVTPPPEAESTGNMPAGLGVGLFALFGLLMLIVIFIIVMRVIGEVRYGYLVLREGSTKAKADMKHWAFWGGAAGGFIGGSSFGSGGGGDFGGGGGFSAGGGDFGGGGASGGW
jgi:uncharacterized protein